MSEYFRLYSNKVTTLEARVVFSLQQLYILIINTLFLGNLMHCLIYGLKLTILLRLYLSYYEVLRYTSHFDILFSGN